MNITRLMWIVTFVAIGPGTVLGAQPLRPAADVAAPTAKFTFTMDSENGDFVGAGLDYRYTEADAADVFINVLDRDAAKDGLPDFLDFIFRGTGQFDGHFWTVSIATHQTGAPLQAGTYEDAQRASFADPGHPGLDVGGNGRGCNRVEGRFTISVIEFDCVAGVTGDPQPHLKRLELQFEQHCEGAPAALRGTLSITDDGGVACAGGGTPGTPPPPPPPPLVKIHVPTEILEQGIVLGNEGSASFEISTSTLETFNGEVGLSAFRNGPAANGLEITVSPDHIPAPGVGTATVTINTGPMTFPREYLVNILATTLDEQVFSSQTVHVNLFCNPPMILGVDQPKHVTVDRGATASLSVRSLGSGPLHYQWYRGPRRSTAFPVAGATSSMLNLPSAADSNWYWVRVGNACGSADSQAAFVTVR